MYERCLWDKLYVSEYYHLMLDIHFAAPILPIDIPPTLYHPTGSPTSRTPATPAHWHPHRQIKKAVSATSMTGSQFLHYTQPTPTCASFSFSPERRPYLATQFPFGRAGEARRASIDRGADARDRLSPMDARRGRRGREPFARDAARMADESCGRCARGSIHSPLSPRRLSRSLSPPSQSLFARDVLSLLRGPRTAKSTAKFGNLMCQKFKNR